MRRLRRAVIGLAVTAVLVVAAAALFTDLLGRQLIPGLPLLRLQQVRVVESSSVTLERVRELATLSTAEYVHRAVFPYDYLPRGVSLPPILRKLRAASGTVRDALTEDEYRYFRAHTLASDVGLAGSDGSYSFVVVTLVVTAGIDLATGAESIEIEPMVRADGSEGRRAVVRLASASIVDVAVEDINAADYPYPNVALSPDGWRRVAAFVRDELIPQAALEKLLLAATRSGRDLLRGLLRQAGFDEVVFE